jgi:hypothetical protein
MTNQVRCEHCGQPLFELDGQNDLILHAGGMLREVHGVCRCGHGYHWSTTDRLLERILERYNQRKKGLDEAFDAI